MIKIGRYLIRMQHNTQTFKIYLCAFNVYNDEAFVFFKHFKAQVEDKKETKIKVIGIDRAGEYFWNEFLSYCEEHSIYYITKLHLTLQK